MTAAAAPPEALTVWCEHAWLPEGPAAAVAIDVADGRICSVRAGRGGTRASGRWRTRAA